MAAKGASSQRRIQLNRAAFDEITLAVADGAFELAKEVILSVRVPDAEPYGQGLIEGGGVIAFVGKKRVGLVTTGGQSSIKKPRAARLGPGINVIAGYGFPGRFLEEGTIHMKGQPYLTPKLMSTLPDAEAFVKAACYKRKVASASSGTGGVYRAQKSMGGTG